MDHQGVLRPTRSASQPERTLPPGASQGPVSHRASPASGRPPELLGDRHHDSRNTVKSKASSVHPNHRPPGRHHPCRFSPPGSSLAVAPGDRHGSYLPCGRREETPARLTPGSDPLCEGFREPPWRWQAPALWRGDTLAWPPIVVNEPWRVQPFRNFGPSTSKNSAPARSLPGVQGVRLSSHGLFEPWEGCEGEWGDPATGRAGASTVGRWEARAAGRARVSSCRPAVADRD